MSLRLILIHFIYRVVFGVGMAALMWVGGHLVYAKAYQLYAMSKIKNDPGSSTSMSDAPMLSQTPLRRRRFRHRLETTELEAPDMVREADAVEENPSGISTGLFVGTLSGRLAATQRTELLRIRGDEAFAGPAHRMALVRELQALHVGDTIQLSTSRGIFGYFVTTIEVIDPSESRTFEYPDRAELIIVTTPPYPFAGAVPQQFVVHARPQNEAKN